MRTSSTYRSAHGIFASMVLTLGLSTAAFAQAGTSPAKVLPVSTKQVGAWIVVGSSQGHCTAERQMSGAASNGGRQQLLVLKTRAGTGYAIALSAPEWQLKPLTTLSIEVVAPVMRSDITGVAVNPKQVVFSLDGQFFKEHASAPMMEVKAAQATFKLPLEGFANTLKEIETCFGALKQPTSNPIATPSPNTPRAN